MTGRRLLDPHDQMSYSSLRDRFSWQIPERFNMGAACYATGDPDAAALVVDHADETHTTLSFAQIDDLSSRFAAALIGRGARRGDRIAIVAPQSVETGIAHLGAWKAGCVSLPLASLFGPDALAYRLNDSGATLAVVSPDNAQKVAEAAPDLPVIITGADFDEFCSAAAIAAPVDTLSDDPAYLIYTSGTTGQPKGALHAHRSLFGHLPGFESYYEFPPQPADVIWTPADWAWIGGLMDVLVPSWYFGMTVLTTENDFTPTSAIDLMVRHRVTLAFLPPTALKMMRAEDVGSDELSLRAIFTGGEPLGGELLSWAGKRLGCRINEGYGQTEANLVVGNCSSVWPIKPGSMGRPLPGHDVAVLDDEGRRVIDAVGEICVRAPDPVMMLEYWNRPGDTAAKFRGDWLLTGDLGLEDSDGYLWFRSRKDDVISSMGYRIGPGEIEESLLQHPAVAMAAVIGIPDDVRGHVPAAFVVLRDGVTGNDQLTAELQNHVRTRLAGHEVPRQITYIDDLPRTTTGKIMRRAFREL